MRRTTISLIICIAVLAGVFILQDVDPAIALDPRDRLLQTSWAYLDFVLYAGVIVTGLAAYSAARIWIKERRVIDAIVCLAIAIMAGATVVPTQQHLIEHYAKIADSMFASARADVNNLEFGKVASLRQEELSRALASNRTIVRRIRALPRYSLYDYEASSAGSGEYFFVSMTIEGGKPKLTINLRSDLVPVFDELPRRRPG